MTGSKRISQVAQQKQKARALSDMVSKLRRSKVSQLISAGHAVDKTDPVQGCQITVHMSMSSANLKSMYVRNASM